MDPPKRPPPQIRRDGSARSAEDTNSSRIAHTLTACCRCRTRKTRCDPGLPRCGPCERTNSHCEYFDPAKGTKIPRNYVVHLQQKVRELEKQLAELDKDDAEPDPEDLMRGAAAVHVRETDESKFLGPSSGIAMTRLVMKLAKEITDSKSISDIVSESRALKIKETFKAEDKPTSKIYPLISDVAAEELPNKDLTDLLVQLFTLKVHPMYPIFHEPSLIADVEEVYQGTQEPVKNFSTRMVIAISLQKMDTQYAGLADSYYLAALKFLEPSIKPMDLRTLQCFALIAAYSTLTPTRTAVYYIIGLAVRLAQALGFSEEKTIGRGRGGQPIDPLEVDMRRRVFWSIAVMEFGLAHSLGRPSTLATAQAHFDVNFFSLVDDQFITREGILPAPRTSLKKWISTHFFKMRLLQLEIRRKLYQKKRPKPKDDQDPWFQQMEAKLAAWRDSSPEGDAGSGLNKAWFMARYNTIIVFLLRPSPQVPRPSIRAAVKCYEAAEYNIYLQKKQIETKAIDVTWIFTQTVFMAINCLLWTLSYSEIRQAHSREDVSNCLHVALEAIECASERWPGVLSAIEIYQYLIEACLKIYDKDGDIPIVVGSPSGSTSGTSTQDRSSRSRTTSPATTASNSISTPEKANAPFGYINYAHPFQLGSENAITSSAGPISSSVDVDPLSSSTSSLQQSEPGSTPGSQRFGSPHSNISYDPSSQFNPLPDTFNELTGWNPLSQTSPQGRGRDEYGFPDPGLSGNLTSFNLSQDTYPLAESLYQQSWDINNRGAGLNHEQQNELMRNLEASGTDQIANMIEQSNAIFGYHTTN